MGELMNGKKLNKNTNTCAREKVRIKRAMRV